MDGSCAAAEKAAAKRKTTKIEPNERQCNNSHKFQLNYRFSFVRKRNIGKLYFTIVTMLLIRTRTFYLESRETIRAFSKGTYEYLMQIPFVLHFYKGKCKFSCKLQMRIIQLVAFVSTIVDLPISLKGSFYRSGTFLKFETFFIL